MDRKILLSAPMSMSEMGARMNYFSMGGYSYVYGSYMVITFPTSENNILLLYNDDCRDFQRFVVSGIEVLRQRNKCVPFNV